MKKYLDIMSLIYIFAMCVTACDNDDLSHFTHRYLKTHSKHEIPNAADTLAIFINNYMITIMVTAIIINNSALMARFMGPIWGLSGADRAQVGPMLAP